MSEILTIDTTAGIQTTEKLDPLPLYGEDYPMLLTVMPEYDRGFPNPSLVTLAKRLKMTMKLYGGLGLSANQCGVFERVFVIGTEHFQIACINPKIIAKSEEVSKDNEGCLSFPALYVKVERPNWCDVEFYDETGTFKQIRMEGLTARCFLHELDHLNGIKFTDHAGPVALKLAQERQRKMIKQMQRISKNAKKLEKTK